ncbi:MAG: aldehyde dehydrogenase [Myxococcota bacterium]|nr:aldehyde dehydrogenase [Myxococcota bacterium]
MAHRLNNWIGGLATPPRDRGYFDNLNPATNEILCHVPRSKAVDVELAVQAAQKALPAWASTSAAERADLLEEVAAAIENRLEEFAALESSDQGKPIGLARSVDIPRAITNFRFFAGAVRQLGAEAFPMPGALNYTSRKPIGVVGLITPWNLPLYLLSWKTAPALAMGNCIVAKPSELTPMTADALADVFAEVGAPPGIFNLVQGIGAECGQAIVEHPDIKAISFTGGTATGRGVAATAAPLFKKLSLELGGKNASIVFSDCDFEKAIEGTVRAGFANQGEICLCGSRVLVERPLYERFQEAFTKRVAELRIGDPAAEDTQIGALNSLAHRDKVLGYIKLAETEGGTLLTGGGVPSLPAPFDRGAFLEPTVVDGLSTESRTATEEIFGPVVTLHPFDTEQEALEMANCTRYGLSASVWTQDLGRAHRVSKALDVGMVWVNTWLMRDLRVPFGGVKESGVGREGGRWSMEFFSETKNICIKVDPS